MFDPAAYDIVFDLRFFAMMFIVFLAGVIRGFTGFGSALLTVPALSVLYGPVQAVAIEILIEIPVSLGLLPLSLRMAERRTILPMLLMFVVFVPIGALLLAVVNVDLVKILIALFVLFSVALMAQQNRVMHLFSTKSNFIVGAISGTTQGLTGMAGPLFATALMARGESSERTRANITALAAGIIALSVISFWALGLFTQAIVFYALLACPAILAGVWLGSYLFSKLSQAIFRPVILTFLTLVALYTLYETLARGGIF